MSRRALPFLVLAATTVALAWWVDAPADVDDAAITYRYAENIATGHGFVYNLGESVWGTTAPLFTLLLVPFVAMGVPAQAAALALGLMGAAAAAVLAADLAGRLTGSRVAFWMAGSWSALAAPLSVWAVSGMETLPYAALLLGTWSAHQRQRTHAAAALAGLAWLMRPDGLVIMMALLLALALGERRLPWKELGTWLVVVAPWTVFTVWRFHTVLPQTLTAKQAHVQVADRLWFFAYFAAPHWWLALMVVVLGLFLLARAPSRIPSTVLGMILWLTGYAVAFTLVGIDFYEWYCVPAIPFIGLLAAYGTWTLATAVVPGRRWRQAAAALVAVVCVGPLVLARSGYVQRQNEYLRSVESTRMAVGRWLRQHTDPHAIVATGAIGHVGREAGRTILDHAGLVSAAEGPYDYVVGNDGYPGPADRYGAEAGFLRWNRLVAKFTPAPPFAHMTHKVYQHLSVASPLPEALLFRNGYLERPAELRLQGPILDLASSAAASHLAEGWSVPEPEWGTWATATTAALDLILELGLGTHVELTLAPFEVPGQVQQLAIEHNGRLVLPFTPLGPGLQTVGFDLDESGLDGGVQRLVLRTTRAVSPRELGQSDDSRTLAVVVRSLKFSSTRTIRKRLPS